MYSRSRLACGDCDSLSATLHVTHIAWRSITGSEGARRWRRLDGLRGRRRHATAATATMLGRACGSGWRAVSRALGERERLVDEGLFDLASGDRHDPSAAVDDEALGHLVGAVGVGEFAGGVAQRSG